jgi:hypothetical protein
LALDRDEESTSCPGHIIPLEGSPVAIEKEAGCAPELVLTCWRKENLVPNRTWWPDHPAYSLVTILTRVSQLHGYIFKFNRHMCASICTHKTHAHACALYTNKEFFPKSDIKIIIICNIFM